MGANDVTCISTFFSNGGFLVAKVADIFWQSIDRSRGKVSLCVYRPLTDWGAGRLNESTFSSMELFQRAYTYQ
ncbi:hypothetical protein EDM60_00695 [Brevibacillus parabrevis]|nr:hypothetical protein EDM60_00695 [Brevibacillus parabrevis]